MKNCDMRRLKFFSNLRHQAVGRSNARFGLRMTIEIQDLIDLLAELACEKNLQAAATGALKGGLITGCTAALGGLILGPVGLAIGGVLGGGLTAISSKGNFRSVALILRDLSPSQKRKLYDKAMHAFRNVGVEDLATLSVLLMSKKSIQDIAIQQVTSFLRSDMNMQIASA